MTNPEHTDTSRSGDLVERLTDCLAKANAQAEHFEREWYLRADRIEALEAENERLRGALVQIRDRKWNTMTQGCDAACEAAQIARAALGEKQ